MPITRLSVNHNASERSLVEARRSPREQIEDMLRERLTDQVGRYVRDNGPCCVSDARMRESTHTTDSVRTFTLEQHVLPMRTMTNGEFIEFRTRFL